MMFSNGKWNCVLLPGSGTRTVRAVRDDGRVMQRVEARVRTTTEDPARPQHHPQRHAA